MVWSGYRTPTTRERFESLIYDVRSAVKVYCKGYDRMDRDEVADAHEALLSAYDSVCAERDAARANARILAHSYKHDSRPPGNVVEESLAYPISPEVKT